MLRFASVLAQCLYSLVWPLAALRPDSQGWRIPSGSFVSLFDPM